jgi:hypothetical protein
VAQTAARYAGTVAEDSSAGTTAWTNPTNAQGSANATVASAASAAGGVFTRRLKATNFGFTTSDIPSGSTINGFLVRIRWRGGTNNRAFPNEIFAVKGGTTQTSAGNIGNSSVVNNTLTNRSYGGATEKFGLSWTVGDVTSSGFGLSFQAGRTNTTTVEVAWFEVVVDYTAPVTHATTGALTGQGSAVAGTAARSRAHASSGALAGQGSTIVGSAARSGGAVSHDTSGALTGQIGAVAGTAARTRAHASSGVLAGQGSAVSGASTRYRAFASSGALTGQGATVAGSGARTRVHPSAGVLVGQGSEVSGSAARTGAPAVHATTGALVGAGSLVTGSASRSDGGPVAHETSGAIVGAGAAVSGSVARSGDSEVIQGGHPKLVNTDYYRSRLRKQYEESEPEVVQAIEAIAEEAPKVDVSQADADALMRAELQRIGIAYREAYTEIYLELLAEMRQQQEDEQIAAIMVALL